MAKIVCKYCSETFTKAWKYAQHIRLNHPDQKRAKRSNVNGIATGGLEAFIDNPDLVIEAIDVRIAKHQEELTALEGAASHKIDEIARLKQLKARFKGDERPTVLEARDDMQ